MPADFVDSDLRRNAPGGDDLAEDRDGVRVRTIGDAGIGQMARQKEELVDQISSAATEIEQLRVRQDLLEKERGDLEEIARKQEEYERGKKDILEKLRSSILLIEKEELQATRMTELFSVMIARFKDTLAELDGIDENSWADDNFLVELDSALVLVEDARRVHKKALARIDAASWQKESAGGASTAYVQSVADTQLRRGFPGWLMVGVAVSLPIMLFLSALFVLWLFFAGILGAG